MNDYLALRAQEKGLEYVCQIAPEVTPLLRGDPTRLRQVMVNLLSNAIKFTTDGEVVLSVRPAADHEVLPSACPPGKVPLYFEVTDTGIGIPAGKLGLLFQAFTQTESSTTRKYGGTGLGLSISRRLSELMSGKIGARSKPGLGSAFWFTAVFEKQSDEAIAQIRNETENASASIDGARILAVDDNNTNRRVLEAQLRSWKCRYDTASDAIIALEKLRKAAAENAAFDAAILDMQMPGIDGETLGRMIKADDQICSTLLIMMTSIGQIEEAQHYKDIGFSAYFTKPVKQSHLYNCLVSVLTPKTGRTAPPVQKTGTTIKADITSIAQRGVRILLVEDHPVNQLVARKLLKKLGLEADLASNGFEALKALETIPYDLVLMDVQMPEMDGLEATCIIRDDGSHVINHNIPIIAMTAHAMKGDRERCIEAGMTEYVSKPIQLDELAAAIQKLLKMD
ncbi:MAG: response regulator [Candidatus Sumerlaeota bacterium]|nr:response regulator [Candidatus Sumerlaeota bacterium]